MDNWIVPEGFVFSEWTAATINYSTWEDPPDKPGVYVILFKDINYESDTHCTVHILYVGSSKSLSKRYKSHNLLGALNKKYGRVEFYFKVTKSFISKEKSLIKLLIT